MERDELNERALDEDDVKVEIVNNSYLRSKSRKPSDPILSPGRNQDQEKDHFYKGILWSDGVSNKNLSIIPKTSLSNSDCCEHECDHEFTIIMPDDFKGLFGSKQVGKCLFRIETVKECEQAILYNELE